MEYFFNDLVSFSYQWAESLVNGLWLGLLLTGLIVLALRVGRRPDGATGYAVWLTALITITLLPLLVTVSGTGMLSSFESQKPIESFQAEGLTGHVIENVEQTAVIADQNLPIAQTRPILTHTTAAPPLERQNQQSGLSASVMNNSGESLGTILVRLLPAGILCLWLLISGWLLMRIIFAAIRIRAIKQQAQPLEMKYYPYLLDSINTSENKRKITIASSDMVDIPMAAGLGAPMVLLPADMLEDITPHDLKAILLHEIAHLRRWDDWTKLVQKLVEAIMFFHPAVIWIGRQLDIQRELACDDAVIEVTGQPNDYARCLTRLAQTSSPTPTSLMPGALSGREQIFHRIARLVNPSSKPKMSKKRVISMVIALIVTVILSLQVVPVVAIPATTVSLSQLSLAVQSWVVDTDDDDNDKDKDKEDEKLDKKEKDVEKDGDIRSYRFTKKADRKADQSSG